MTMIENGDRGITLAKPLAWTILVAMLLGGIWVGSQIGTLTEVQRRVDGNSARLSRMEEMQSSATSVAVGQREQIAAILQGVGRIERRMDRLEYGPTPAAPLGLLPSQ